jgi:competence protein ComEA
MGVGAVFSRQEQLAVLVLLGLLLASNGFLVWQNAVRGQPNEPAPLVAAQWAQEEPVDEPAGAVRVHVAGSVRQPGVYDLAANARVVDAINAAGGFNGEADADQLNLARPVEDGMRIYVPAMKAPGGEDAEQETPAAGLLNLNSATLVQLESLPGIGPALAARILDYREQHGPFQRVSDLLNVPGIGPAKLSELEDLVTVH